MSGRQKESLFPIAAAVSDGTPIDWEREKAYKPSLRAALEHLSVLERIRDLHRRPLGANAGTAAMRSDDDTRTPAAAVGAIAEPLFTWGPLRVLEKVGEGAWATVYRAFEPSLETEVALKLLKEDVSRDAAAVEQFIFEARRLARVHHENVLIVHGADRHGDRVGMWTEYLRGQSLEAYLAAHGPLSAREATLIGLDLCRALSAVHAAGLVHRDVKGSNVMRAEGGRIVLMDFGSVAELTRSGRLHGTRNIQGTPATMAPEQLRGQIAGAATDIYGLGVLLYHLASGRFPVEAQTLPELIRCHEKRQYVPLRDRRADLSLGFVQVVERAIAPDPAYRYPSAGAMEQAMNATLVAEPVSWKEHLAERWGLIAAAAVVVAVVIGLGLWVRGGGKPFWISSSGIAVDGQATPVGSPNAAGLVPPPGAAVAAESLTASATLHRLVDSEEKPVSSGGRVQPGDKLALRVRGGERMSLYVLNTDEEGNVYVLFPIPGLEPGNPLEAHRTYRLPGTNDDPDSSLFWTVTNPGGRESIVAIAARAPLDEIESVIEGFPKAERGREVVYHKLPVETLRRLRGIGGLSAEPRRPAEEVHRLIDEMLQSLQARRSRTGDVWIWKTELQNPRPRT
jgi:eukaryotic-like serine/threonine-protein kinase